MLKVTLLVTKLNADKEKKREITFDAASISIEDWFEADRVTSKPNTCKIFSNGQCYQANLSRLDLEKLLTENGVTILKPSNQ